MEVAQHTRPSLPALSQLIRPVPRSVCSAQGRERREGRERRRRDGGGGAKASARSPTCTSPLACRLATRVVRRAETATPTIPRKRSTQTSSAKVGGPPSTRRTTTRPPRPTGGRRSSGRGGGRRSAACSWRRRRATTPRSGRANPTPYAATTSEPLTPRRRATGMATTSAAASPTGARYPSATTAASAHFGSAVARSPSPSRREASCSRPAPRWAWSAAHEHMFASTSARSSCIHIVRTSANHSR